jgi:alpha-ketoglutarate-dependent taurine dioxygenase
MSGNDNSSNADKLTERSHKTASNSSGNQVLMKPLFSDKTTPLIIYPATERVSLLNWVEDNRGLVEAKLLQHGAILFRGFSALSVTVFQQFAEATCASELLDYTFGSTPRKKVEGKIYTSTEYPNEESIPLHNEMSYAHFWPRKIWFYCAKVPTQGGATPIADSVRVFERIKPRVREKFIEHGVVYVRNYREGLDLSYRDVFGTDDQAEIGKFCREAGIEYEFVNARHLRTKQRCQAVAVHPQTGQTVWFNQAHLFHISNLDPVISAPLLDLYGEDGLPRNCYYGNGAEIEEADLDEVREAYRRETITFVWKEGDILMLDNMLVAHGREPFAGERKIVVAMGEQDSLSSQIKQATNGVDPMQ